MAGEIHPGTDPAGPPDLATLARMLGRDEGFPSLPEVIVKVRRALEDAQAGARDLANVILRDPPLSARLLRLANSAWFRRSRAPVTTVTQAIVLLGFESVRNLTLGLTVYRVLAQKWSRGVMRAFWRDSLCCALVARAVAEHQRRRVPEEFFVAGLLHDIGRLLLWMYAEPWCRQVERAVLHGTPRLHAERDVFGFTHEDAGALLAEHWAYPPIFLHAIRRHHADSWPDLDPDSAAVVEAIALGDLITLSLYGAPWEAHLYHPDQLYPTFARFTRASRSDFLSFYRRLDEQIRDLARVMEIPVSVTTERLADPHGAPRPAAGTGARILARRSAQLHFLNEMTQMLCTESPPPEMWAFVLHGIQNIYGCRTVSYGAWDPVEEVLDIRASTSAEVAAAPPPPAPHAAVAEAMRSPEPATFTDETSPTRPHAVCTLVVVPVSTGGGPRGALVLEWLAGDPGLGPDDRSFLQTVGTQLAILLHRAGDPAREKTN